MDLAKLKKLEAQASPAPWWRDDVEAEDGYGKYRAFAVGYDTKTILDTSNSDVQVIYDDREDGPDGPCGSRYDETGWNNTEFVAEMRNATPALIAKAEKLEKMEALLMSQLAWVEHWERDRQCRCMPTEGSLAEARKELSDALAEIRAT